MPYKAPFMWQLEVELRYKAPFIWQLEVELRYKAPFMWQLEVEMPYKAPFMWQLEVEMPYKAPKKKKFQLGQTRGLPLLFAEGVNANARRAPAILILNNLRATTGGRPYTSTQIN